MSKMSKTTTNYFFSITKSAVGIMINRKIIDYLGTYESRYVLSRTCKKYQWILNNFPHELSDLPTIPELIINPNRSVQMFCSLCNIFHFLNNVQIRVSGKWVTPDLHWKSCYIKNNNDSTCSKAKQSHTIKVYDPVRGSAIWKTVFSHRPVCIGTHTIKVHYNQPIVPGRSSWEKVCSSRVWDRRV